MHLPAATEHEHVLRRDTSLRMGVGIMIVLNHDTLACNTPRSWKTEPTGDARRRWSSRCCAR